MDDSSGSILGAYFVTQETLKGYYNIFYQVLTKHGKVQSNKLEKLV